MSNPQPKTPLVSDASDNVGHAPPEQQAGHHPDHEADKPDLAKFAQRLGVPAEGDEPHDAPNVTGADGVGRSQWKSQWKRLAIPAVIVVGLVAVGARRARTS